MACCPGGSTPGAPDCGAAAGNPINVMGGNKYQRDVDMAGLPGVQGLELVRHYNSDFSAHTADSGESRSSMGRGWRLSYDGWLRLPQGAGGKRLSPQQIPADAAITFSGPDGTQVALSPFDAAGVAPGAGASRQWVASGGNAMRLSINPAPGPTPYVLSDSQGFVRLFDAHGRLVRLQAASGHATQIERDPFGRIVTVTDPQGRQLVLNYRASVAPASPGKPRVIYQVESIQTPLGRFDYAFGSEPAQPAEPAAAAAGTSS